MKCEFIGHRNIEGIDGLVESEITKLMNEGTTDGWLTIVIFLYVVFTGMEAQREH